MPETEPKYKIGQIVSVPNEDGTRYHAVITDTESINKFYWVLPERESDKEYMYSECELQPVLIYPDYGEVFCKDCENCDPDKQEGNMYTQAKMNWNCPVFKWYYHSFSYMPGSFIEGIPLFVNDTTQPPPNCHCFKPRVK